MLGIFGSRMASGRALKGPSLLLEAHMTWGLWQGIMIGIWYICHVVSYSVVACYVMSCDVML